MCRADADAQSSARRPSTVSCCFDRLPPGSSGRLLVTEPRAAEMMGVVSDSRGSDSLGSALERIPRPYSLALRLRDAGVSAVLIADCLDIEPEAVDSLLRVAEAKLATVQTGIV